MEQLLKVDVKKRVESIKSGTHTVKFGHRPEKVHSYKLGGYLGIEHSHLELGDGPNA